MSAKLFLDRLIKRTAVLAIGPSTLRNQGASGVVSAARDGLSRLNLAAFRVATPAAFDKQLNASTERLRKSLPPDAQHWGTARKAINIYLRDVVYSVHLSNHFGLSVIRPWLEVPLDSYVAMWIKADSDGKTSLRWCGVKHLTPKISADYQEVASQIALRKRLDRVDLDILYWRTQQSENEY
jgi:hypothetical protein